MANFAAGMGRIRPRGWVHVRFPRGALLAEPAHRGDGAHRRPGLGEGPPPPAPQEFGLWDPEAMCDPRDDVRQGSPRDLAGADPRRDGRFSASYPPEVLRQLARVREDFARKAITPPTVGTVFRVS